MPKRQDFYEITPDHHPANIIVLGQDTCALADAIKAAGWLVGRNGIQGVVYTPKTSARSFERATSDFTEKDQDDYGNDMSIPVCEERWASYMTLKQSFENVAAQVRVEGRIPAEAHQDLSGHVTRLNGFNDNRPFGGHVVRITRTHNAGGTELYDAATQEKFNSTLDKEARKAFAETITPWRCPVNAYLIFLGAPAGYRNALLHRRMPFSPAIPLRELDVFTCAGPKLEKF